MHLLFLHSTRIPKSSRLGRENLGIMEYPKRVNSYTIRRKDISHFLGTDSLGRDLMIRIMVGSKISLLVGIVASAIILVIGSTYGAIAGYFGGKVDMMMMRTVDIIYTIPIY